MVDVVLRRSLGKGVVGETFAASSMGETVVATFGCRRGEFFGIRLCAFWCMIV
jgi:hypothetical protein